MHPGGKPLPPAVVERYLGGSGRLLPHRVFGEGVCVRALGGGVTLGAAILVVALTVSQRNRQLTICRGTW